MLLQLNQHEHELLEDVLGSALSTLREEVYQTDAAAFAQTLKQREELLVRLLDRLQAAQASGLSIGEPIAAE